MDYSKMSDFEINQAIACILNPGAYDFCRGEGESVWFKVSTYSENKDYCNNPADAWQIIAGNLIALKPVEKYVGGCRWFATKGEGDFGAKYADENPLRAAMCLFLMMQESANVPANPAGPDIR